MKIIALAWRDPLGNLKTEKFNAKDVSVKAEPGWLKILGPDGPIRLLPSEKVHIVEFAEEEELSRIASPHVAPPLKTS